MSELFASGDRRSSLPDEVSSADSIGGRNLDRRGLWRRDGGDRRFGLVVRRCGGGAATGQPVEEDATLLTQDR